MKKDEGLRKLDRFMISRKPIAVDPGGLVTGRAGNTARLPAVWFRRRNQITVACLGALWGIFDPAPGDWQEFMSRCSTGRYGPDCEGRWDGDRYWGAQYPGVIEEHLAILVPMLVNYPEVPEGYDGWWTFHA